MNTVLVEVPPPAPVVFQVPVAPPAPAVLPPSGPRVRHVTVELHGIIAGPTKTSGHPWDGPGDAVRPEDLQAVSDALALAGANPHAAAAGVVVALSGPAIRALDKPDVAGWATVATVAGEAPSQPLPKVQGSFTPSWRGVRFQHVPLDGSTRLRVGLTDLDVMNDDPMGTFEIGPGELQAALRSGKVYPVPVAGQTGRQVLFAQVSVFEEPASW